MHRVAKFDVARPFESKRLGLLAQLTFGLGCALAMVGMRSVLDVWAATAGPFALVYPTVLIATLFGHWQAGLTAYAFSFLWAWYYVLAPVRAWTMAMETDPPRVLINAISVLVVLVLAEAFRRAVTKALEERDRELEHRKLLQQEIEHRTKNNFALAASLLEMQKRREEQPAVKLALDQAIARIHSFASAYANLALTHAEGASVAMDSYLAEIVDRVTRGAFHNNVVVDVQAVPCIMSREVAVAIGLFTNEALTNCAKYAFPDGRDGKITVRFDTSDDRWSLDIADNGVGGGDGASAQPSGLGTRLLEAFARQAQADYAIDVSNGGRRLRLASAQQD